MNKNSLLVVVLLFLSFFIYSWKNLEESTEYKDFIVPKGWPKPVYDFKNNQLTSQGFELGRELFYDPILSKDSTISCASCHLQYTGFAHTDHALSHGIEGRIGTRNAPTLANLAWSKSFHWDGGVVGLEVQPINPITNSLEMDNSLLNVLKSLKKSKK